MQQKKTTDKRKIFIIIVSLVLSMAFIILPLASVGIYEACFGMRYETEEWLRFSPEEFGLLCERSDFTSSGITLAGYKYSKAVEEKSGVVVLSHGLGGGGHNGYMPIINALAEAGYYVFAYDARGNDNSGGGSVEGLVAGVADLDSAINHLLQIPEYSTLPVALIGHSFGGYSVGAVLNKHPEVRAAIIVSGFNESEDLLTHYGRKYTGNMPPFLLPYMQLYEQLKFGGEYTELTALGGMSSCDAKIMIIHSKDDTTVPPEYGYDKFYLAFEGNERFEFVLYEDRGHSYLLYSDAAAEYRKELNEAYVKYAEESGREYSAELKAEFMSQYLDKGRCFEPDAELLSKITNMLDGAFR